MLLKFCAISERNLHEPPLPLPRDNDAIAVKSLSLDM